MTALVQKNHGWLLSSTADDAVCVMPQSLALNMRTGNEIDELQDGHKLLPRCMPNNFFRRNPHSLDQEFKISTRRLSLNSVNAK